MSLFDRFRKKAAPISQQQRSAIPVATAPKFGGPLREEVGTLYDRGVNPIHAIKAMLYETDGNLTTDAKRLADIWLGINDLLDRDDIETDLRNQLVGVRDVLAKSIEDSGEGPKAFIENYRENTRKINEMKYLQSYKLADAAGTMQFDLLCDMLTKIEYERANNPGSLAQDISGGKLARLYNLRDNWDDPSKLK
jgi:hypothetical protein